MINKNAVVCLRNKQVNVRGVLEGMMDRLAAFAEGNPDAIPPDMKCVSCPPSLPPWTDGSCPPLCVCACMHHAA